MKALAIASIVEPFTNEISSEIMPGEVPATFKHYLDDKIEPFWIRPPTLPAALRSSSCWRRTFHVRSHAHQNDGPSFIAA